MSHGRTRVTGQLAWTQKLQFARQGTVAQLAGLPNLLRATLGRGGPGTITVPQAPPDSLLTRRAVELAREAYRDTLLNHCLRCWYFGDAFAQLDNRRYDAEMLYVACLLHDLGLTESFPPAAGAACFAVHGGEVARTQLAAWGADTAFADTVAEAIALHMDIRVPFESGAEAHLLHAGAHLDVAGVRSGDIPRSVLVQIVKRCPRDGFAVAFLAAMRRESRERPDSRAAVMWRQGMRLPVTVNPLNRILTSPHT